MNEAKNIENSTEQAVNYTACCAPVLIHIRYCSWGGHPKDRWMWEGIVARNRRLILFINEKLWYRLFL